MSQIILCECGRPILPHASAWVRAHGDVCECVTPRAATGPLQHATSSGDAPQRVEATKTRTRRISARDVVKSKCPTELSEQIAVCAWAALHPDPRVRLLFAIPNGTYKAGRASQGLHRASGLKSGIPDLMLPVMGVQSFAVGPTGHVKTKARMLGGCFLEMKRVKGATISPEQRAWHEALTAQGYLVVVARGADAAIAAICVYLGLDRDKETPSPG